MNAIGGVPENTSVERGSSTDARERVAARQQVAMEVHAALRRAGRARGEGDDRDVVGGRVDRLEGAARRAGPRSRARRSSPTSPARSRVTSATVTRAFVVTFSISRARSSGIVATTIPPASRMPSQHAIASGVFGECSSTRVPGSIRQRRARPPRRASAARRSSSRRRSPSPRARAARRRRSRATARRAAADRARRPRRQVVAGERVGHRSTSRAMISCWTSDAPS